MIFPDSGGSTGRSSGFGQQLLERPPERGEFPFNRDPYERQIDTKIVVRQPAAHASDPPPWHLRPTLLHGVGEMLDGFPDDFELADDRILAHPLRHERVTTCAGILLDVTNRVENVTEVDAVVLHSGRASARMCGRIAGWTLRSVMTSTFR